MGNLFRSSKVIHDQTTAAAASLNGEAKAIRPGNDAIPDFQQEFSVVFNTTMSGGAATPTLTQKLQTSWDGASWIDVAASTELTADGNVIEQKAITLKLGPFVRAAAIISGTVSYTGSVRLVSNAHFTVASAA